MRFHFSDWTRGKHRDHVGQRGFNRRRATDSLGPNALASSSRVRNMSDPHSFLDLDLFHLRSTKNTYR